MQSYDTHTCSISRPNVLIDSNMEKNSSSWPSREAQELDLREEQVEEEADMAGGDSEGGGAGLRAARLHPRPSDPPTPGK